MKLFSTIAILGTLRHAFANPAYTPSGRFQLVHGDPKMSITTTFPNLVGEVHFSSIETAGTAFEGFSYSVEYYNMAQVTDISTCDQGTLIDIESTLSSDANGGSVDHTAEFALPDSVWQSDSAKICARMMSTFGGEEIDAIETLATVTRSFTGEFTINVATRTKAVEQFTSTNNENEIGVEAFLCDSGNTEITEEGLEFAQGQDFNVCVKENTGAYDIGALKNVICSYGSSSGTPSGVIEVPSQSMCLNWDNDGALQINANCNEDVVLDASGRIVLSYQGSLFCIKLYSSSPFLYFDTMDQNCLEFTYNNNQIQTTDGTSTRCLMPETFPPTNSYLELQECSTDNDIFSMDGAGGESLTDTLVDAGGSAVGLTTTSDPGAVMSFTGVVKAKYFMNDNTALTCTGDVDLDLASTSGRRLEALNKNLRFTYSTRALESGAVQTRDLQEDETEFSVDIKLDNGSSSATASKSMISMGLLAAGGLFIALI